MHMQHIPLSAVVPEMKWLGCNVPLIDLAEFQQQQSETTTVWDY